MLGLRTGLCLAIAVAVTGLTMAQAGSAATQTPFKASLSGSFAFGAPCPASAPAGAVCLVDNVTGTASHLGRVSGRFVVAFDFSAIDADNCLPIRKTGSFEAANGD